MPLFFLNYNNPHKFDCAITFFIRIVLNLLVFFAVFLYQATSGIMYCYAIINLSAAYRIS